MEKLPNLAGVATSGLVETIGAGSYAASYINWSRTMHMLREHAPGWMPELVHAPHGGIVHAAPVGAFLMLRFRHLDGTTTPDVPQAIMDNKNKAIPLDRVDARDITDTHRRGVCMAAAFTFGLAFELWAKVPLESGHAREDKPEEPPYDSTAWLDAIDAAIDMDGLRALSTEMKGASIPDGAFRNIKAIWQARAKAVMAMDVAA